MKKDYQSTFFFQIFILNVDVENMRIFQNTGTKRLLKSTEGGDVWNIRKTNVKETSCKALSI